MPQAQTIRKQLQRRPTLRGVAGGLQNKTVSAGETLVEFVKVLEKIEVTHEKIVLNSKGYHAPDGSFIEY